jgi:hypothetical protein
VKQRARAGGAGKGETRVSQLRLRRHGDLEHLAGELFRLLADIEVVQVQLQGVCPRLTDTIAGRMHYSDRQPGFHAAHVKEGRLRLLAVTTAKRSPGAAPTCTDHRPQAGGLPGTSFTRPRAGEGSLLARLVPACEIVTRGSSP